MEVIDMGILPKKFLIVVTLPNQCESRYSDLSHWSCKEQVGWVILMSVKGLDPSYEWTLYLKGILS